MHRVVVNTYYILYDKFHVDPIYLQLNETESVMSELENKF